MLKWYEYRHAQKAYKNIEDYEYRDNKTDLMIKSVLALETSLFSQMDSGSKRINKIKEAISRLEDSLLDLEQIDKLDPGDKMALYNRLTANLHKELALLQNLQHSIPQALDNIDSLDAIKSERRERSERKERSQQAQNKKEQESAPASSPGEKHDHPYLNKIVINGHNQKLGRITKIIDGQFPVLAHKMGDIVLSQITLGPSGIDNVLRFRLSEEDLMKGPPYKKGNENDLSWIKAVRAYFAVQPTFFHPTSKFQEPIRKPDPEEGDNSDSSN